LEKQALSPDPLLLERLQRFAYQSFLVMNQLICRINGPEA